MNSRESKIPTSQPLCLLLAIFTTPAQATSPAHLGHASNLLTVLPGFCACSCSYSISSNISDFSLQSEHLQSLQDLQVQASGHFSSLFPPINNVPTSLSFLQIFHNTFCIFLRLFVPAIPLSLLRMKLIPVIIHVLYVTSSNRLSFTSILTEVFLFYSLFISVPNLL